MTRRICAIIALDILGSPVNLLAAAVPPQGSIRVATVHRSINRDHAGQLVADLSRPDDTQARNVAAIIPRVRPDLFPLSEFDYDPAGRAVTLFRRNTRAKPRNGTKPIEA